MNLAVLVSGGGTNLQALIDACASGYIPGRISIVISSSPCAAALERASKAGIENVTINPGDFRSEEEYSDAILSKVSASEADLICLAGFLKKLGGRLLEEYKGRIINIHPALLPSHGGKGMYGLRVHKAVIKSGSPESGCTVHYVNEDYDRGEVIARCRVPVEAGDTPETLAAKVLKEEHRLYPEIVRKFAMGELPRRER